VGILLEMREKKEKPSMGEIDLVFLVSKNNLKNNIKKRLYTPNDEKGSDHCPVVIDNHI
jgi:exonuclease III